MFPHLRGPGEARSSRTTKAIPLLTFPRPLPASFPYTSHMPTALPVILFDDGRGQLSPLTDLRPVFDVRIGALSPTERVEFSPHTALAALVSAEPLAAIAREKHRVPVNPDRFPTEPCLMVNARWAAFDPSTAANLDPGEAAVNPSTGELLAAHGDASRLPSVIRGDLDGFRKVPFGQPANENTLRLLSRPWDARRTRDAALAVDLGIAAARFHPMPAAPDGVTCIGGWFGGEVTRKGGRGAFIHPTARLYPTVVLDSEHGPIVIDEHAVIRPGATITGPVYIGPHSTVLDRAIIRGNTAIGPHCKVAGEVSGTVFQGYSNKAHDGFLGDSWIGEWVNLGAGTTNSNLLNTYSEIICRATPDGPNERTGETFLGAIIGDHVKTAISTRIMTGSIVHTGSMFATTAPVSGTVGRFTWATDAGARAYRLDKFLDVARAAMARRKLAPSAAYIERLQALAASPRN